MIIKSENVWLNGRLQPASVEIENGVFKAVMPYGQADVDYGKNYVLPGFIDMHTHGNNGVASAFSPVDEIERWQKEITADGVTSFMATTATERYEDNLTTLNRLSGCVGRGDGAEILGIYMEGNFINPASKGAHDEKLIMKPNPAVLQEYIDACHGKMKLMILAAELDTDGEMMKVAAKNGVKVSVGHSSATYDEVVLAHRRGAVGITHTYNGMRPFNHRETGIIGAALTISDLYAEIIADGHHVSWPAVKLLAAMKDSHHLILVTDDSPFKDWKGELPAGIHKDAEGQFRNDLGALTSSSLRVCDGIFNLITKADVPFEKAINAATINPATLLGVNDRKGSIDAGKDADIAVVTPDFKVVETYCKGMAMLNR